MKIDIVRMPPYEGDDVTVHYHLNRAKQGKAEKWSIRGATCREDNGKESRYRVLAYVDEAYLTACRPIYQMGAIKRINQEGGAREVYAKVRGHWRTKQNVADLIVQQSAEWLECGDPDVGLADVHASHLQSVHLNPRRNNGLFTYGVDGQEWRGSGLVYFPSTSGTLEVS